MKRKSLKRQHGRYLLVFTMRYGDHWSWCSGAQLPSLKLAHGRRKNRRNISAEIYNAVKMSLFPFPPRGDGRGAALQQPGCQADCGLGVGGRDGRPGSGIRCL